MPAIKRNYNYNNYAYKESYIYRPQIQLHVRVWGRSTFYSILLWGNKQTFIRIHTQHALGGTAAGSLNVFWI